MNTITPSPVHPIPIDELLWLHSKSWSRELEPVDLPFQPDPQHTCPHGSERVPDDCGCDEPERYESYFIEECFIAICALATLGMMAAAWWWSTKR